MAFIVRRPADRFEIRESTATSRGPRARTLVSFVEMSDEVLDLAQERARGGLDRARLRARAVAMGAHVAPPLSHAAAHDLLRAHGQGERLPVAVAAVLRQALDAEGSGDGAAEDHLMAMLPWLGAPEGARAMALVDLLGVSDALPPSRRGALRYPRFEAR